jgi:hypothetical protein
MARDVDAAKMDFSAATNVATGTIQWVVATNKLQRWSGAAWVDLVLSVAGGGTAGIAALGTMAYQNAAAVAITGGTIANVTALDLHGHTTFDADGAYDIGTSAVKVRGLYVKTTLVIPTEA